ncbi:MAG: hypothetical protein KIT10_14445 [Flavobacteriales bacterium]|nr:hypothetical protein [Flavobacteriales bacterium]
MSTYSRFFLLWKDAKSDPHWPYENHGELVREFTRGGTDSLRRLTVVELRRLERRMEEMQMNPRLQAGQRMRRKIIGILAARGAVNVQGKPDMAHVYAWVRKYGYLGKELNAYTVAELPKLVSQAEAIVASDYRAIQQNHG